MSWSRNLSAPITLDNGRIFTTLRDAANFVLALPDLHRNNPHWQFAMEAMMKAAENDADLEAAERQLDLALRAEGVFERVRLSGGPNP